MTDTNGVTPKSSAAGDCGTAAPVNCDTALYSLPLTDPVTGADTGNYTIVPNADGSITVADNAFVAAASLFAKGDGVDTLWNIENLRFCTANDPVTKKCTAFQNLSVSPPAAPTNVVATAGNTTATRGTATVTWNAVPGVSSYDFQVKSGGVQVGTLTSIAPGTRRVVTGLVPGRKYTFALRGVNRFGTGAFSADSNEITATGVPGQTGAPTAIRGNAQVSLSWTPGVDNGSPVTGYLVTIRNVTTATTTTQTLNSPATSAVITGLTNGQVYNFRISATNAIGTGAASGASANVTPARAPDAPVIGTAVAGTAGGAITATANWTQVPAAGNGGLAVTSYTINAVQVDAAGNPTGVTTSLSAGAAASTRIFTFTTAQSGTSWQFEVLATNGVGNSPLSARSNTVVAR